MSHSNVMCNRCHGIMFGDIQRVWFHNDQDDRWVALYLRGIHQLWQGDTMLEPKLLPMAEHTQVSAAGKVGKPAKYHELSCIPKRAQIRDWLTSPPEPPFTIAVAESGQKHILFLAKEGHSRDRFPVQFEMDSLDIDRAAFVKLLGHYESLLNAGFSKTEVDSGEYRADRLIFSFDSWQMHDPKIARERYGDKPSRLLQLISFVAIKPEFKQIVKPEKAQSTSSGTVNGETKKEEPIQQLALF